MLSDGRMALTRGLFQTILVGDSNPGAERQSGNLLIGHRCSIYFSATRPELKGERVQTTPLNKICADKQYNKFDAFLCTSGTKRDDLHFISSSRRSSTLQQPGRLSALSEPAMEDEFQALAKLGM